MTAEEFDILKIPEIRRSIEENIDRDPVVVAMRAGGGYAALVATQVKYLQRARRKLPSYYAARCVIPPRAFEQASSEAAAARMEWRGGTCIDLTCGLGVDSLALSRRFGRVVAVERDPVLARVAAYNFDLLGANNVEVVNAAAEDFLARWAVENPPADLIYVDPDRRGDQNRKLVLLESLSPDVASLMPLLRRSSRRVAVKLSPLFDVDEAFRIFGPACRVEVVSEGGECKQVVVETGDTIRDGSICATSLGWGSVEYPKEGLPYVDVLREPDRPEDFRYLIVPDVALQKSRLVRRYFGDRGMYAPSENGFVFARDLSAGVDAGSLPGRVYRIGTIRPYQPKILKKTFRDRGIPRITVLKRDFPESTADIMRQLGVGEGGGVVVAFTTLHGKRFAIDLQAFT